MKEREPVDTGQPWAGERITACELQEFSFVRIGALLDAIVLERARKARRSSAGRGMWAHRRMAELYERELRALRRSMGKRADGEDWR